MLAAPPPPPPPPPVTIQPNFSMQATQPPPFHSGPPPPLNVQQQPPPMREVSAPPPFLGGAPPNIQQQPPMQPPFEGKTFRNEPKNVCQIGDFTITLSIPLCGHAMHTFFCLKMQTKKYQILEKNDQRLMVFYVVFSGNNYLNENQMNRNCGNIEQMDENPRQSNQSHSLPPLNTDLNTTNTTANIAATKSTIPTTIDGLIEFIAVNGDEYEEKILTEIAQMNERTLFR